MTKVAFKLPGNRGVLSGPEGLVVGNEMRRGQTSELPQMDALFLTNCHPNALDEVANSNASVAVLSPLLENTRGLRAAYGRVSCYTGVPGTSIDMALYRLQGRKELSFRMVAHSKVSFSGEVAGVQTVKLSQPIDILPNYRYFMGMLVHGAGAQFLGGTTLGGWLLSRTTLSTTTLPEYVPVNKLIGHENKVYLQYGAYLSEFGAQVL